MKLYPRDLGDCGSVQMLSAGTVKFDTEEASAGIELYKLPANIIVVGAHVEVTTAFNGTSPALSVGVNDEVDDIVKASDVTAVTVGAYSVKTFSRFNETKVVKAKLFGSGVTEGEAEIYLEVVRCPAK